MAAPTHLQAAQLQRMSQLAIDVENLKMRNALLETELLRARQVLTGCASVVPTFTLSPDDPSGLV